MIKIVDTRIYTHSIVTTHPLVSFNETRVTSHTTMGRRKVHLHKRGVNVVITIYLSIFYGTKFKRVFSAANCNKSNRRGEMSAKGKNCEPQSHRVSESYAPREDYLAIASNAILVSWPLASVLSESSPKRPI